MFNKKILFLIGGFIAFLFMGARTAGALAPLKLPAASRRESSKIKENFSYSSLANPAACLRLPVPRSRQTGAGRPHRQARPQGMRSLCFFTRGVSRISDLSIEVPEGSPNPGQAWLSASASSSALHKFKFKKKKFKFSVPIKKKNKGEEEDMSRALINYGTYCTPCHGPEGKGDGPLGKTLEIPPRDHTDADIMSTRTDQELFGVIHDGGAAHDFSPDMPAQKGLMKDSEIWGLVHYIRKLCHCRYEP